MIYCATKRNPLDFNGYGCWCGLGGKGTPVDDLDRCCQAHDWCYDNVIASKVCPFNAAMYLMPYSITSCTSCICSSPSSSFFHPLLPRPKTYLHCQGPSASHDDRCSWDARFFSSALWKPASYYWYFGKCRHALCECDATAAKCFANSHYNEKYKHYSRKNC
ncbi:phospholipase A2 (consuming 1,2-dipalmitoylphosphatidylcholine) [Desmophyllum pertusum]|uniref:Phospholipase A2 n=1 Tax=Desmophyllum pertusum TaxID=174260 RepID=A0A9W9ZLU0_9CNID|nr:phospholipase A2 (consuming 1,2-dipalmitoylphosphatidylcholine) [Desmophyllum pertusum]